MKALILAAGIGSRLGLDDIPKPMYEIAGKPVLEHNVLLCKKHNVKDICINLHHKPEAIKNYFGDGAKWNVKISYSFEEKLLGTSGAVKNVQRFWDSLPFFVIYGDNYTEINLSEMLNEHRVSEPLGTVAVFDREKVKNSGIAGGCIKIDENKNLISFVEGEGEGQGQGYVNAGVYILKPEILDMIPSGSSDFGRDIFPSLVKKGHKLRAYVTESFVIAIDTKEALQAARKVLNKET